MGLRTINLEQSETDCLARLGENKPIWNSMRCRLVTPMYGGGVQAAIPDIKMPIRAAAIRGQLRFWWRLLAKQKWGLQDKDLHQAECALWGGMGANDTDGQASKVFLRVREIKFKGKPVETQQIEVLTALFTEYAPNMSSPLNYALFPARPAQGQEPSIRLFKPDLKWELHWRLAASASENDKQQVLETLRWWVMFGGVGARTRRGCGAFIVETCSIKEIMQPISVEEAQEAGCRLVMRQEKGKAEQAWKEAVERLRDFRQKANVGRNPPSEQAKREKKPAGRSRWPEPDAIRKITKHPCVRHQPEHPAGNIFPRAMFGMPIIFHFKDKGEPADMQLLPKGKERMASPIIVRPIWQGREQWVAGALLLPIDGLLNLPVELKGNQTTTVTLWDSQKAAHIKPIQQNGGENSNPLDAFLNYFTKK